MLPVSRGQGLALEKAAAVGDLTQRALRTRTRTRDVQDALFPYMSHSLIPPVSASRGQGLALEKAAAVGDLTQRALRTRTRTRDVQDALFPYMSHSLMLPVSADNASLDE